jgi:hypothetical protein
MVPEARWPAGKAPGAGLHPHVPELAAKVQYCIYHRAIEKQGHHSNQPSAEVKQVKASISDLGLLPQHSRSG